MEMVKQFSCNDLFCVVAVAMYTARCAFLRFVVGLPDRNASLSAESVNRHLDYVPTKYAAICIVNYRRV